MKNFFANAVAAIYFICIMLPFLLILFFIPLMMIVDIGTIMKSGFSGQNIGFSYLAGFGLIFGISMFVPNFRRIYKRIPWLYVYIQIFMVDILILTIGTYFLNTGFEIDNLARHKLFLWLMIATFIIGRLIMCLWYKFKPIKIEKE